MRFKEPNKLIFHILFTGMICSLFLVAIVWGMAATPRHTPPVKVMRFKISSIANRAVQTAQVPPSVSGRKAEHQYHQFIVRAASQYQIDPALIKAIILAESGYNPKAVSKRGAKGLMQLMPETALSLGVVDIFNPRQNITGGVQYFKHLVNRFNGDVKLALAAYNAGSRYVRNYDGVPPFKATRYYIKKVFKYYRQYKKQTSEGIDRV